MIHYQCSSCGSELETPDENGGSVEACPACATMNDVPKTKTQRNAEKEARKRGLDLEYDVKRADELREKVKRRAEKKAEREAMSEQEIMKRRQLRIIWCAVGAMALALLFPPYHYSGRFAGFGFLFVGRGRAGIDTYVVLLEWAVIAAVGVAAWFTLQSLAKKDELPEQHEPPAEG